MNKLRTKSLKKGEVIPLNMDFMFTSIFNKEENIDILENFLSCYLEIPLEKIKGNLKILKRKLNIDKKYEASNEVDLLFNYNNKLINIELSNERKSVGIIDNIVFACKIHGRQIKYGDNNYNKIGDSLQINLNNFRCNKHLIRKRYFLVDIEGENEILSEKLRIDMVDLVLGSKMCYNQDNNKLSKWCRVLLSKDEREIKKLLSELMEKESGDKLMEEINRLSSDHEYVELYTKLSKKELEYNTYIEEAKQEGFNDGFFKGGKNRNIEIAKLMLQEHINVDIISKITGLSIDKINSLE